jgi:hypothetical protein
MSAGRTRTHKAVTIPNITAKAFRTFRLEATRRMRLAESKSTSSNKYLCAVERNQNGKYNVRIRAIFGQDGWVLPVYFLTSSFNLGMKKLEQSLQYLQKNEERLRFWAVERTDDPTFAGDLLQESGLGFDRRKELPKKSAELGVTRERPVTASLLGPIRRLLSDSISQERPAALAAD